MSRYSLNPDRLFDRPWRPGHPFHPKSGRLRRLSTAGLLIFLCALIWGYGYATDAQRVRSLAQAYLSDLIGGRVKIEKASLSIFEGLRLDGVQVYVDPAAAPGDPPAAPRPDGLLFSSRSLTVQVDPRSILAGRLEARQIVAEQPQVHLSRDLRTGRWNFQRVGQTSRPRPAPAPAKPAEPMALPEVLLRNAMVEVFDLTDGDEQVRRGHMALDGRFRPPSASVGGGGDNGPGSGGRRGGYEFVLQSRGASDAMGPLVTGWFDPAAGTVAARLDGFQFGPDVKAMLPDDVGKLLERLELTGQVDVERLAYNPGAGGKAATFAVEMALKQVNFSVPPDQWMSKAEAARREDAKEAAAALRRAFAAGGFARAVDPPSPDLGPAVPAAVAAAAARALAVTRLPATPADGVCGLFETAPVRFRQVSGTFAFDEAGVEIRDLHGRVESNPLTINGKIEGYDPDAKLSLTVASPAGEDLTIPPAPRYVWSMPAPVREFYEKARPQGTCRLSLTVARRADGGPIDVGGYVDLVDAKFVFDEFPYPARQTRGRIEVARDPATKLDWLMVRDVRGLGFEGGPNRDRYIALDGWVGPLNVPGQEPGGQIKVRGQGIRDEPALSAAFDEDVRDALSTFDAGKTGKYPTFRTDVSCLVHRPIGDPGKFKVDVDLDVAEADGRLKGFEYPLRNLSTRVEIREGYANIIGAKVSRGGGSAEVNGKVAWKLPGQDLPGRELAGELAKRKTDLTVAVRGLPIDDDLLAALPADATDWVRHNAVRGTVDVDGRLTGGEGGRPAKAGPDESDLDFDLAVHLKDAALRPEGGRFEVAGATASLRLTPGRLDVLEARGGHGSAALSATARVTWAAGRTRTVLVAGADNLALDDDLYRSLPPSARAAWDEVRPTGTLDAEITYAGETAAGSDKVDLATLGAAAASVLAGGAASPAVTVVDLSQPAGRQATRPTAVVLELPATAGRPAASREVPAGLHATLRPKAMSGTLRTIPIELADLGGEVYVAPDRVELRGLTGRHGKARFAVGGTGTSGPGSSQWELAVSAKDLPADADLRRALPPSLAGLFDSLNVRGTLGLELGRFSYRSGEATAAGRAAAAAGGSAAAAVAVDPEIDLNGRLTLTDVSLDAGAPMDKVQGSVALEAAIRGGRLWSLGGHLDVASLDVAGRAVTDLRAQLSKAGGTPELLLRGVRAAAAGGDLAGDVTLVPPDADGPPAPGQPASPGQYKLSLFVRNADVRELAKESGEQLSGRVTASLAMEGNWGQAAVRRGRGDVSVSGREMYRIPLVLGLTQVTNLALPISSPFSSATARYSVDGQRVNFERIELRSNNLLMTGDGQLDFGTKQVKMLFVTDNPAAFRIPFLHDLWRGAQQELVRIHVRGTVEDPKVQNRPLGTFTTTVDQVFRGDGKGDAKADGPKTKATKK